MKTEQSLQPAQIRFTTGISVEPAPASPVEENVAFFLLYQTLTASSDLDIVTAAVLLKCHLLCCCLDETEGAKKGKKILISEMREEEIQSSGLPVAGCPL